MVSIFRVGGKFHHSCCAFCSVCNSGGGTSLTTGQGSRRAVRTASAWARSMGLTTSCAGSTKPVTPRKSTSVRRRRREEGRTAISSDHNFPWRSQNFGQSYLRWPTRKNRRASEINFSRQRCTKYQFSWDC